MRPKLFSWSYGWSYIARVYSVRLSRFWSFTASTPHCLAMCRNSIAFISDPWWLWPTSAMTYASPSSEMRLPSTTSSLMTGDGTATGCQLTVRGVGFGRGAGRSTRASSR